MNKKEKYSYICKVHLGGVKAVGVTLGQCAFWINFKVGLLSQPWDTQSLLTQDSHTDSEYFLYHRREIVLLQMLLVTVEVKKKRKNKNNTYKRRSKNIKVK